MIYGIVLAVTDVCVQVLMPVAVDSLSHAGSDLDVGLSNVRFGGLNTVAIIAFIILFLCECF